MPRPKKRSFSIARHRTSLSLEEPFWEALRDVARGKGVALAALVALIDAERGDTGLSSAVRLFLLRHYRQKAPPEPVRAPLSLDDELVGDDRGLVDERGDGKNDSASSKKQ